MSLASAVQPTADRLLRNTDFLRLWLGQVVSTMGLGMARLALPLLALALTDSPAVAGLIAATQMAPFFVLGLPAGALVDRWNRRVVMIVCDIARALAVGSVPVAWAFGFLTPAHLFLVALAQGSAQVFFSLAQIASLPRVVSKGQLASAHGLNTASEGIAQLTSPGLGGFIIGLAQSTIVGAVIAYLLNSLAYLFSVFMLSTIRTPFQVARANVPLRAIGGTILEGLRYVWSSPVLRLLATVNMTHRGCLAPVQLAVIVFATDQFQADAPAIGLIFSAAGAGGLLAAAITPRLRQRVPVGVLMMSLIAAHAVGLAAIASATSLWLVMVGMLINGMMDTMSSINQVSYRLAIIPDNLQGRVNSVYRLLSFGGMTIGTAAGGVLLGLIGPRPVMWLLAGLVGLIATLSIPAGILRLRNEMALHP